MTSEQATTGLTALRQLEVNTDDLFDVLSNPRRRFVIARLDEHAGPMSVADVADELARWESETATDEALEDRKRSRRLTLHHVHVPKMAEAGVVEYDRDNSTISLADGCEGISTNEALPSVG